MAKSLKTKNLEDLLRRTKVFVELAMLEHDEEELWREGKDLLGRITAHEAIHDIDFDSGRKLSKVLREQGFNIE